tara:strand:- start:1936 stop:2463 length:528 start_codon:yes stop_codon:yes gene_type:complete
VGERTTRFCDSCEKTLEVGRGFALQGKLVPIGSDDADENVVESGDYCPTCLGKKMGMTPDVFGELFSGLDELFGTGLKDQLEQEGTTETEPSDAKKPNLVDVIAQSLDDLAELVEPSDTTKQQVKDLGKKVQKNWSAFSVDLQTRLKKVFNVDESNPTEPKVTPRDTNGSNGSAE